MVGIRFFVAAGAVAASLAVVGCSDNSYSNSRPDINSVSPNDVGLQSKDVVAATNQMVTDLLASPALNSSPTQWTLAVANMQDLTSDRLFATNYDIFMASLRAAISEKGAGRIQLIANKSTFNGLRSRELEDSDPYGQNGGNAPAGEINPDYILYGKAYDLPNRSTDFYLLEFDIVNAHTREQVWSRTYQVKTNR